MFYGSNFNVGHFQVDEEGFISGTGIYVEGPENGSVFLMNDGMKRLGFATNQNSFTPLAFTGVGLDDLTRFNTLDVDGPLTYTIIIDSNLGVFGNFANVVGTFLPGETITGGTSGTTAQVHDFNTNNTLFRGYAVSGSFTSFETVTGGTSGATAEIFNQDYSDTYSFDDGTTSDEFIAMVGFEELTNGISMQFGSLTGHTVTDQWTFDASRIFTIPLNIFGGVGRVDIGDWTEVVNGTYFSVNDTFSTAKLQAYNGFSLDAPVISVNFEETQGDGISSIVCDVRFPNNLTDFGPATVYTPAASNLLCRISVYVRITTPPVTGLLNIDIDFVDVTNTPRTINIINSTDMTDGGLIRASDIIELQSGNNVDVTSTITGLGGTPDYSVYVVIEKLMGGV